MAAQLQRKNFTITWRILNYNFFLQDCSYWIHSPWFLVDTLDSNKWGLRLSPAEGLQNEFICLAISNEKVSMLTDDINFDYCFSISSDHSSLPPFVASSSHVFLDDLSRPCIYVPKDKVFEQKAGRFIPPDIMTIKSQIWKREGSLSEDGECTMITKAQVERVSFVGVVENFSDLTSFRKKALRIRSASVECPLFSMNINQTNGGVIFVEIIPWVFEKIEYCKCLLSFLDNSGNETECGYDEFLFLNTKQQSAWKIPLQFSKKNLMELRRKYLLNDCLSLQCEIAFSTGKYKGKILKTKYAVHLTKSIERPISGMQKNTEVFKEDNRLSLTMQNDLMSWLSKGMFCDTKLQTATETFFAHKLILSVRSPVFSDLFNNRMKEKVIDCVQIEDLDAETVRRFLLFMYSDCLKDLDLENAKKLYFAGEKYEVFPLKCKCSHFLEKNLCPSNCCDVLILADKYSDSDLKKAAQEYIAQHDKEVLESDQWKSLEETNINLAFETFRIMYKRNRRNSWNGTAFPLF
ncbi:Speckle-type POZ protein [Araneus ventricosus]|uniref:Speckle-type POZ protein n=1 Tax=Araneus ventricosus TaxID=182803 RepID=A0A4Y2QTI6_ARAVE|nr:Speckle-type POZ protein [Araneus ventricosus]